MALSLPDALDPAAIARLGNLELVARTLVEGFLKGLHLSAARGSSVEFAERRPYAPGDEIRRLDWRAFGKTDRFYLKEYDDETNVRAILVLDASGSMAFASGEISKFRYAACLAAALGLLLLRQRDSVGLLLAGAGSARYIPPKATPQHLSGILAALEGASPRGEAGIAARLHDLAGRWKRRSLAIVVSDFLEDPQGVLQSLARLRHRQSEAIFFHVLDPAEEEFPFSGWTVFRDMERPGTRARLDARQARELYAENFRAHLEALRKGCDAAEVDYLVAKTTAPFEGVLARYLDARERRSR
ncbi:MAG: DUF58 domain-containing protein [Planctomycetota bacterium]